MKFSSDQNILIVDDEPMIVDLLENFFHDLGFSVATACSAEDALEKLSNGNTFHLILTDINMPGKSGLDLLKIIRETNWDLPVVILTGLKTLDNAISAVKSGATDYITKPFELITVQKVVEKIFRKQKRNIHKEQIYDSMNYLKMNFQFETDNLDAGTMAKLLVQYLEKMKFGKSDELVRFELAFTETILNAIEHGNLELSSDIKGQDSFQLEEFEQLREQRLQDSLYGKKKIVINFECTRDIFSLTLKDEGNGFDWKKYLNNMHQVNPDSVQPYGRGFHLIRHVIDEVHFNEKGNIITLIKNRL